MEKMETISCIVCGVIGVFITSVVFIFVERNTLSEVRKETCSYYCLSKTKKWPSKVEYLGRNDKGRIQCECFVKVEDK